MQSESPLDTLISAADRALRSLFAPARASRPMPVPQPPPAAAPHPSPAFDEPAAAAGVRDSTASDPLPPRATPQASATAHANSSTSSATNATTSIAPPGDRAASEGVPGGDTLSDTERRHSAALMRVNHSGEIAAQALYHGQALIARSRATRDLLLKAAHEETDHLAWCEARLKELDSRPSLLNPLWYAGSFAIGAMAALLGDRTSLGFVVETERQVEGHLNEHLARLSPEDARSRAILQTMRTDEIAHGMSAKAAGGAELPSPVRSIMRSTARIMTSTAYWI
jgi:3-demethoxyubiquinol 3-hydroxylase